MLESPAAFNLVFGGCFRSTEIRNGDIQFENCQRRGRIALLEDDEVEASGEAKGNVDGVLAGCKANIAIDTNTKADPGNVHTETGNGKLDVAINRKGKDGGIVEVEGKVHVDWVGAKVNRRINSCCQKKRDLFWYQTGKHYRKYQHSVVCMR